MPLFGSEPSVETIPTFNQEQRGLSRALFPWLESQIGQGMEAWGPTGPLGQGEQPWWTAPLTGIEQAGLGQLSSYVNSEYAPMFQGALSNALQGMSPDYMEQFYRENILPRQQRMFRETTIPSIEEAHQGRGTFWGSPRTEDVAGAAQQFGEFTSGQLGDLIMRGRESAFQALPYAGGLERQIEEAPLRRAEAGLQYGGLERQLQNQELAARLQEFMRTRPELSPIIQQTLQGLGVTSQAAVVDPGGLSPFAQILMGLAPGVGYGLGSVLGGGG